MSTAEELVRRMHAELLPTRDLDRLPDFFAASFRSHNMPPGLPQGLAGVRAFFGIFLAGLDEIEVSVDDLVADGDRVAVATTTSGVHTGELFGVAPTGHRIGVTGIDFVRVEDGRIVEHRGLTDTVGLLRQLHEG